MSSTGRSANNSPMRANRVADTNQVEPSIARDVPAAEGSLRSPRAERRGRPVPALRPGRGAPRFSYPLTKPGTSASRLTAPAMPSPPSSSTCRTPPSSRCTPRSFRPAALGTGGPAVRARGLRFKLLGRPRRSRLRRDLRHRLDRRDHPDPERAHQPAWRRLRARRHLGPQRGSNQQPPDRPGSCGADLQFGGDQ